MQEKIIITGGPGTGKSTVLNELQKQNFLCMHEISRDITLQARKTGIEQLFLKDPVLFSKLLLEGREIQYKNAHESSADIVFFDRGIPDINAYMNYMGIQYDDSFIKTCQTNRYTKVFIMPPWEEIYITDNERYESFEQALAIHNHLKNTYVSLEYELIDVPFNSVNKRVEFILTTLKLDK